ncbi:hypothetical protein [Embleya sp. NPDC059259]|uniref:hypothetical protein n=1 Tax=unclassified Embleya TaxID=2699296 RepID=UPI003684C6D0
METTPAHGHVTVPRCRNVEITTDPFDRPADGDTLPRTRTGIIDGRPVPATGTEGVPHLDTAQTVPEHRFVVVASAGHVS